MGIPEIIWIALNFMGLGIALVKHGQSRNGERYNFWISGLALVINVALLWWGGFFD